MLYNCGNTNKNLYNDVRFFARNFVKSITVDHRNLEERWRPSNGGKQKANRK